MNRRNLLKTAGLAWRISAILPFDALAKTSNENPSNLTNANPSLLVSDKKKIRKIFRGF